MSDELNWSIKSTHVLVETEVVSFEKIKKENKMTEVYYLVEIHSTQSDEIGLMCDEVDGVQHPTKFDSFSKARVQAAKLEEQLGKSRWFTKIISKTE